MGNGGGRDHSNVTQEMDGVCLQGCQVNYACLCFTASVDDHREGETEEGNAGMEVRGLRVRREGNDARTLNGVVEARSSFELVNGKRAHSKPLGAVRRALTVLSYG